MSSRARGSATGLQPRGALLLYELEVRGRSAGARGRTPPRGAFFRPLEFAAPAEREAEKTEEDEKKEVTFPRRKRCQHPGDLIAVCWNDIVRPYAEALGWDNLFMVVGTHLCGGRASGGGRYATWSRAKVSGAHCGLWGREYARVLVEHEWSKRAPQVAAERNGLMYGGRLCDLRFCGLRQEEVPGRVVMLLADLERRVFGKDFRKRNVHIYVQGSYLAVLLPGREEVVRVDLRAWTDPAEILAAESTGATAVGFDGRRFLFTEAGRLAYGEGLLLYDEGRAAGEPHYVRKVDAVLRHSRARFRLRLPSKLVSEQISGDPRDVPARLLHSCSTSTRAYSTRGTRVVSGERSRTGSAEKRADRDSPAQTDGAEKNSAPIPGPGTPSPGPGPGSSPTTEETRAVWEGLVSRAPVMPCDALLSACVSKKWGPRRLANFARKHPENPIRCIRHYGSTAGDFTVLMEWVRRAAR